MESSDPNTKIDISYKPLGRHGKIQAFATWDGGSFAHKFDLLNVTARQRFVAHLLKRHPAIPVAQVEEELDRIAGEMGKEVVEAEDTDPADEGDSATLIDIARDLEKVELFHAGAVQDAMPFARVRVEDHSENMPVRGATFQNWIRFEFYKAKQRSPSTKAFTDAINTIASIALYDGEEHAVFLRVAPHKDSIVIDLCDNDWCAVIVDESGWRFLTSDEVPVRFIRKRGMLALPVPERGGSIEELRPFVNIPAGDSWILFTCTLVSLFRPRGPYVVIVFSGEQGSAKSSTMKKLRALVDPSTTPARRLSRDDRDLMIAATNSYVLCFDNLSVIPASTSDALCSLATGGGFSTRQLYTDDEEKLFDAMRPVILNGIEDVATRADLLDRCLILRLPRITEEQRKEEKDLDARFELVRPRILGVLFSALSTALRRFDSIKLDRKPRMADFARFCVAAETALGLNEGDFYSAYMRNRGDAVSIALESSSLAGSIQLFMSTRPEWTDTAAELLKLLEKDYADDKAKNSKDWPKNARGLSEALKRLAPALRAIGIDVSLGERDASSRRKRLVSIRRTTPPDAPDGPDAKMRTTRASEIRYADESAAPEAGAQHNSEAEHLRKTASGPSGPSELDDAAAHEAAMGASEDDNEPREYLFDIEPLPEDL